MTDDKLLAELQEAELLVTWFRRHLLCTGVEIKTIGPNCFDPRLHCSGCSAAHIKEEATKP